MRRLSLKYLQDWLESPRRLPMVLSGARQVGKTWLVRQLAQVSSKELIELNFESNPQLANSFVSNDPKEILITLSAVLRKDIKPSKSILFLDEVQAMPQLIAKLRWFAEEMPELATIATGSLLEFALADFQFSMPVGRITFMHLEPLSFEEFLFARGRELLQTYLAEYSLKKSLNPVIHEQLTGLMKEYTFVGGMPAAVVAWCQSQSFMQVGRVHQDLWATYRSDFNKYRNRISMERLEETVTAVPRRLGQKFVYSNVNSDVPSQQVKEAIRLLNLARVCHRVSCTAADGMPLGAQTKDKFFKEVLVDVGLACSSLGLSLHQFTTESEIILVNSGGVAEQLAGQLLRTIEPYFFEPALFYWLREERGSQAEIDYIIHHGPQIVPVEVKAGATGTLKSLHLFMQAKKLPIAVRLYSGLPVQNNFDGYKLLSLPLYLTGQLHRLLDELR